jgi:hypothetical protein
MDPLSLPDREEERVKELKNVRGLSHDIFVSTLITYSLFCYFCKHINCLILCLYTTRMCLFPV